MGVQTVHPSCEWVKLPSLGICLYVPLWRTLNWSRHVEDTFLSLEIPVEGTRIRDKRHGYNTRHGCQALQPWDKGCRVGKGSFL
jgi:hypothetical protein